MDHSHRHAVGVRRAIHCADLSGLPECLGGGDVPDMSNVPFTKELFHPGRFLSM
ncbi:MAG: hypothetical protein ACSLFI_13675 [Solirubrobacterales bacterium]